MNPFIAGSQHNQCFTSGLLTGTGAETVYDTTVTISYCVDGVMKTKTAVTDGATPTTDGNTGAAFNAVGPDEVSVFVWGLNVSGTVSVYQGSVEAVDGDTNVAKIYPQFPMIPDGITPFAYTIFQTDGTSSAGGLLFGTANWNATGLTATHVNVSTLPLRPRVS
jgi:hypothetical protein